MVLPQVAANPTGEVIVLDNINNASTSRQTGIQFAANRNKRHLSGASIQSSRAKRKTPTKEDLSRNASSTNLQQEKSAQVSGVGSSKNVTKLAVGTSLRIPDTQTTDNATYEQPIVATTSQRTHHGPTQAAPSTSTGSTI